MQIDRLLEIVFVLINKKHTTAKQLANQFDVSARTIYRDIDTLSLAGIPIYCSKGKGGGINILNQYTLDKSFLSETEQKEIINGLHILKAIKFHDAEKVLNKVSTLFKKYNDNSWLEIDFSYWGSTENDKTKFLNIEYAILNKYTIKFEYYNSKMKKSFRCIEPLKLLFKSNTWYIQGYCRTKKDIRTFKVTRIRNLELTNETFKRDISEIIFEEKQIFNKEEIIHFKLNFSHKMAHRIFDDFASEYITFNDDKSFTVNIDLSNTEWTIHYLLSFGKYLEIIEPIYFRDIIKTRLKEIINIYK